MKQETLEEAAKRLYPEDIMWGMDLNEDIRNSFIIGYKLAQEKSYSQLDVVRILSKYETLSNEDFNKWFEQFKKK